ncbi:unnamed protein product [Rhizophagus irregularis]|nr:unnamed protein product [Rhizophagus irregularis]
MELVNIDDENSFNPTPTLKSSPLPIKFISFDLEDKNCIYCGNEYFKALFCHQFYCKKCLSIYINDINDNNIYLDVYIYTMDLECNEHEISKLKVPQSIQECCRNCVRILCFKQIYGYISDFGLDENNRTIYNNVIESEKNCKLCRKSLYQGTDRKIMIQFKLCSACYLISSGFIESTLFKKQIPILYLPWWYNSSFCIICRTKLKFTSDCQKYCVDCYIFYIGCRYCLTTNIIFGLTDQSQCRKCKRISLIIDSTEYNGLDDFLLNNIIHDIEFANSVKIDEYFEPQNILNSIFKIKNSIRDSTLMHKFPKQMSWSELESQVLSSRKRKRCIWFDEADMCLSLYLNQNKDKIEKLNDPHSAVKVGLWNNASKWMLTNGYSYSADQCFHRWKNNKLHFVNGILRKSSNKKTE